ncbi:MAG TPA: radical SAM protein [Vicinamibacterales bacterium]|nr:radical SAM protein [Vicinamibacterales bacterium]
MTAWTATLVRVGEVTNRTLILPLVMFSPTSRCNSRCISCDWWRHSGEDDLSIDEIDRVSSEIAALGTRLVVFSGGEPLLRPEVFEAGRLFRARGLSLHLLTSGILLERFADRVARLFARVCVSLDARDEALYERIRGVAALATVERGIARLRHEAPAMPITARATLHRENFRELPDLIDHARRIGLDGISFLAADVSSPTAFGRRAAGDVQPIGLDREEVAEFEAVIERTIQTHRWDFANGFVAESPDKLRRLARHYAAVNGDAAFPGVSCNAPWVSIVIEADGSVRPCFFHDVIGNVRTAPLETIVTRDLPAFRRSLRMGANPVCERCVCSLKAGWRNAPWLS